MNDCLHLDDDVISNNYATATIINEIFFIGIKSTVECLSCLNRTEKVEPSYMLCVEVNGIRSLNDALAHFFYDETLTGDNAYGCGKCNDYVTAKKFMNIDRFPPILIINLKRSISDGVKTRKLLHRVQYSDVLNIGTFSSAESSIDGYEDRLFYHLYAIIVHIGDHLDHGHYRAYVRTRKNTWMLIDDADYKQVHLNDVLNHQSAYVLFYARTTDLSLGTRPISIMESPTLKRSTQVQCNNSLGNAFYFI